MYVYLQVRVYRHAHIFHAAHAEIDTASVYFPRMHGCTKAIVLARALRCLRVGGLRGGLAGMKAYEKKKTYESNLQPEGALEAHCQPEILNPKPSRPC